MTQKVMYYQIDFSNSYMLKTIYVHHELFHEDGFNPFEYLEQPVDEITKAESEHTIEITATNAAFLPDVLEAL